MSATTSPQTGEPLPPLDALAAGSLSSKISRHGAPWLHNEVARRMAERLPVIRQDVRHWVHWAPRLGGLTSQSLLELTYPKAECSVVQTNQADLAWATQALKPSWWRRWLRPQRTFDSEVTQAVDMLWANMSLHSQAQPLSCMRQWANSLNAQGFVMFSCLGPDSLMELRRVYESLGWPAPHHAFTDMHDWGDMLLQAGFAAPVMDMERITLTYASPQALLQDLRCLGRNLSPQRFAGLRGRQWLSQLQQELAKSLASQAHGGRLALTFEVIYGHAFKATPRSPVKPQTEVSLQDMKAMLSNSGK